MNVILARSTEVGSRTIVIAAAAGEESNGAYMADGVIAEYVYHLKIHSEPWY